MTDGLPADADADAGASLPYRESSPMANEPLQLNLGSLRSAMSLTLHTHHASRIWHGRAPAEGRPGIIGLNGYISVMNKMKRGAEQDDPYSDWWMLRIEDKLADTTARLQELREQVDLALANVPLALSLGENLNVQPVKLPLFVNAQLGFMAVYLLADYDDLARKLILAHHTALIDRSTLERWLNEGAHALRSLFSLAQQYRYSGTTRDDFAARNAAARSLHRRQGQPVLVRGNRLTCQTWPSPQAASAWAIRVLGEREQRTCESCTKTQTTPGVGLTPMIQEEYETKLQALQELVTGARPTTPAHLEAAGSSSLPITRGVIEALRDEPDQDVLGRRLASEAALSSVLEKALLLQRTLFTGKKEPNVAANELAVRAVDQENSALEQEINNLKTELELRRTLAGNSAMAIIQRHSIRAVGSRGVFEGDTTRDRLREVQKPRSGTP
ncbi:PFL_4669 family integrating conjugative element protein [Stutzerimonas stutzeri]|uniref:PFL_4669 family integrating conjugative element protein n=1 Tax=Stutzerimonas stutzeri TaxID=316 RepID=UPI0030144844